MTTEKLNLTRQIEASLSYVYYLFSNKSGWMEWFAHKVYGYAKKKAMLRVYYEPEGDFVFHFTEEESEERIGFDLMEVDTGHVSQVMVSFEENNSVVTVSLEHDSFQAEKGDFFRQLWEESLDNLKSMAETGRDLRLWNRPFLGVTVRDWVTPEMARDQDLGVDFGMQLDSVLAGRGAEESGLEKGDIIISAAGIEFHDYKIFLDFLGRVKAGDTVDLSFYRGKERHDIKIELSSYPVAEPPATAHDYAERIEKFQLSTINKLTDLFEESNEAQVEFRPGPGERSAKEILGSMISMESDAQIWVSTLVAGCEEYPCSSSHVIRIKGLLALYPTVDELIEELAKRQKETVAILRELPAEFVNRKGSFGRLASGLNLDYSKHYKQCLIMIKENLEKAENVRVS